MTRIGIISDIHGQPQALEAVLSDIKRRGCHQIWCLGDVLDWRDKEGLECLSRVRESCQIVLRGNHDQEVLEQTLLESILDKMPISHITENGMIGLWHGSPKMPLYHYVHDKDSAKEAIEAGKKHDERLKLVLVGHIHIPSAFTEEGALIKPQEDGQSLSLWGQKTVIACPGSVGQPHSRHDGVAQWMSLEVDNEMQPMSLRWHFVRWRDPIASTIFTIKLGS